MKPVPASKSDVHYKHYVTGCLTKVAHKNMVEAMKAGLLLGYSTKQHVQAYKCMFCGKWHITHKSRDTSDPSNHCVDVTGSNGRPFAMSRHIKLLYKLFGQMRREQKKAFKVKKHH